MSRHLTGTVLTPDWSEAAYEKLAEWLSAGTGLDVRVIDRGDPAACGYAGFRLKDTPWCEVHVYRMLLNWRVATLAHGHRLHPVPERYWCYADAGQDTLLAAARAVAAWDGSPDTEPDGWVKNGQTGELRL